MLLRISIGRVLILFRYQIYYRKSSKDRLIYRRIAKGEVGKYYVKFMTNVNCMDLNLKQKKHWRIQSPPPSPSICCAILKQNSITTAILFLFLFSDFIICEVQLGQLKIMFLKPKRGSRQTPTVWAALNKPWIRHCKVT